MVTAEGGRGIAARNHDPRVMGTVPRARNGDSPVPTGHTAAGPISGSSPAGWICRTSRRTHCCRKKPGDGDSPLIGAACFVEGSPADPNRIDAAQHTDWFGHE